MESLPGRRRTRVRACGLNARYDKPDPTPFDWPTRRGLLVGLLAERAPDLLFYQELRPGQRDDLVRDMRGRLDFPPRELPSAVTGQCVGLAWNPERFALLEVRGIDGSGSQSLFLLRRDDGARVLAAAVHWPFRDAEGRFACAHSLLSALERFSTDHDGTLVAGDFNAPVGAPERSAIVGAGLTDLLEGVEGVDRLSYHAFGDTPIDEALGFHARWAGLEIRETTWHDRYDGQLVSDHRLLELELVLP